MNRRERERRYLSDIIEPVHTTVGVPFETNGGWAARLQCPDGRVRMFRTAPPRYPSTPRPLSTKVRFAVLVRDQFRCQYCGRGPGFAELRVDHLVPRVDGGSDDMENLVTACHDCNAGKSDSALVFEERLPGWLPPALREPSS